MSGTHTVAVGAKGRLVVPADVGRRAGLREGSLLVLLESPNGLALLARQQLRDRVRDGLAGLDLVTELLGERRAAAAREDAG